MEAQSGFAAINGAQLYHEVAGNGTPLIMIHAGIADSRMWDGEFAFFAESFRVLRFDMRGYGRSLPTEGEFNIQDDLCTLLDVLGIREPLILMGCSIGAGLAIDFALEEPEHVAALVLVGGSPAGFEIDSAGPDDLFSLSEKAFEAGDVDRVAELDMQIWFDGVGRSEHDVDSAVRAKAFEMACLVADHELKGIGKHVRKSVVTPTAERLHELTMPVLVVVGEYDLPFLQFAADFLVEQVAGASKVVIPNAAHLPNMEHPKLFGARVGDFLAGV